MTPKPPDAGKPFVVPSDIPEPFRTQTEKFGRFAHEFHDESDRGCAVLVMCVLEESLREMFVALLPEGTDTLALCPLGRFKFSIQNAVSLGMLSDREARAFLTLVEVRNKFAHRALENVTFDSLEIASVLKSVPPPVDLPSKIAATQKDQTMRDRFQSWAAMLWMIMMFRCAKIHKIKKAPDISDLTSTS